MPWNPDYYQTGLAARAQRDAAQYNLKLKKKRRPGPKAASSKPQAKRYKLNRYTLDEDVYIEDKSSKPQAPSALKKTQS